MAENYKMVTNEGLIVDMAPDMDRWGDGNRAARQGVPSIERSPCGRLWAAFRVEYSRDQMERSVALVTSDDDGKTWSEPLVVLHDPEHNVSPFDPALWQDPSGRLWFFWSQRPGFDVWGIVTEDPDSENPRWYNKGKLMDGVMLNKPIALSTGEWVLPATPWGNTEVYVSRDKGNSYEPFGAANMPVKIQYEEHMVVERKDKTLWMLVRTRDPSGIAQSFSEDRGKTWSEGEMYKSGPGSRFFIRRLSSGRLLLIYHHHTELRRNLTACLSEDEGKTWPHQLLLEGEMPTSYPDAVQAENGRVYVIYDTRGSDHEPEAEIQMTVLEEKDIIAGKFISEGARSNSLINNNAR